MSAAPGDAPLDEEEVRNVTSDDDLGRAVRVRWMDSGLSVHGWRQISDIPTNVEECESVGLWMGENEHVVMLGGSRDSNNNNWNDVQLIWKPSMLVKEWLS